MGYYLSSRSTLSRTGSRSRHLSAWLSEGLKGVYSLITDGGRVEISYFERVSWTEDCCRALQKHACDGLSHRD